MKKRDMKKSVEEALIDLYLGVKIKKQNEFDENSMEKEEEIDKLRRTNPLTIIGYIRNSLDILIEMKVEEKIEANRRINTLDEEEQKKYEDLLRKLEGDIRMHIKVILF